MDKTKIAVFGEALIDLIEQGRGSFTSQVGGSPFNVCRAFSRQGFASSYLAPVSTDNMGEMIATMLEHEGIHAPFVGATNKPSSIAVVTNDEIKGAPDYTLYRDNVADLDITAEKILDALPTNVALFHTGSLTLVPTAIELMEPVFQYLQDKNIPISIDINMRKLTTVDFASYQKTVLALMKYATYLKVSDEDLEILGIEGNPVNFCKTLATTSDVQLIALTKGELGAHLISKDFEISGPIFKPSTFVDTVGAGDTFFASLLSYILSNNMQSLTLEKNTQHQYVKALDYAQLAASINVSKAGCQPPTSQEIERVATSNTNPHTSR